MNLEIGCNADFLTKIDLIQENPSFSNVLPGWRICQLVVLDLVQLVIVEGCLRDVDLADRHKINIVCFQEDLHLELLALGQETATTVPAGEVQALRDLLPFSVAHINVHPLV